METMVNIYDLKAHLSQFLAEIEITGKKVVICRHNKPVADLVPHRMVRNTLTPDPSLRGAVYLCDPTAPLDLEDWPETNR